MPGTILTYAVQMRPRRLRRVVVFCLIALTVAAALYFGRNLPTRFAMLRLQSQCMEYTRQGKTIDTFHSTSVPVGLEGDRDYHMGTDPLGGFFWYFLPTCLNEFEAAQPQVRPGINHTVVFLHERVSPTGHKRLVIVRGHPGLSLSAMNLSEFEWSVIEPAGLFHDARLLHLGTQGYSPFGLFSARKFAYGAADPADPSHFTLSLSAGDESTIIYGWLQDDDTIRLRER